MTTGSKRVCRTAIAIGWALLLLALPMVGCGTGAAADIDPNSTQLLDLWLPSLSGSTHATWKRENVIQFALEQTSKAIDYLFLASVAGLGFLVNALRAYDAPANDQPKHLPGPWERWFAIMTGMSYLLSQFWGFGAYCYFPTMVNKTSFSIFSELAWCTIGQGIAFFVATVLLFGLMCYRLHKAVS